MDMFADFFRLNYLNPSDTSFQEKIFNDMEITKDKAFVEKYMGQFPIISISLKELRGSAMRLQNGNLLLS